MKKYTIWSDYYYIYRQLWSYKKSTFLFIGIEVLANILAAFAGVMLPAAIIHLLENGERSAGRIAVQLLILFLPVIVLNSLNVYINTRNTWHYMKFRSGFLYRKAVFKNMAVDYETYETKEFGVETGKAIRACCFGYEPSIEDFLRRTPKLLIAVAGAVLYCLIIANVKIWIVATLAGISLLQMILYRVTVRYQQSHLDEKSKLNSTISYITSKRSDISFGKEVRLFQMQDWIGSLYHSYYDKLCRLIRKERGVCFAYDLMALFLQAGRDVVCYGYLLFLLKKGMSPSLFVLYLGMITGLSAWIDEIGKNVSVISASRILIGSYRGYLEGEEAGKNKKPDLKTSGNGLDIEFRDVSYSYPMSDKPVLDHISFRLEAGEKMALVGINGAGKSTLVKLLCGFYRPTEGQILINGTDINEINKDSYYSQLAAVFQDSAVLAVSIAEVVGSCPRSEVDDERCLNALYQAGLQEKMNSLKQGIDTVLYKVVEDAGVELSGGEMQKLLLARVLYRDAKCILLDEPTAAMDAIAENETYQKYNEVLTERTLLFISHRLASTQFCGRILYLENGKIAEDGTHEELLRKHGRYAEMFQVQSRYYREGGEMS